MIFTLCYFIKVRRNFQVQYKILLLWSPCTRSITFGIFFRASACHWRRGKEEFIQIKLKLIRWCCDIFSKFTNWKHQLLFIHKWLLKYGNIVIYYIKLQMYSLLKLHDFRNKPNGTLLLPNCSKELEARSMKYLWCFHFIWDHGEKWWKFDWSLGNNLGGA